MLAYTLKINSVDITSYINYDSYSTSETPVYSDEVVTLDGVSHIAQIRTKSGVRFSFNPQNATTTNTIATALLTQPCSVYFYNLQNQQYETANMRLTGQSAEFLARCKFVGAKWNQIGEITLEEL